MTGQLQVVNLLINWLYYGTHFRKTAVKRCTKKTSLVPEHLIIKFVILELFYLEKLVNQ